MHTFVQIQYSDRLKITDVFWSEGKGQHSLVIQFVLKTLISIKKLVSIFFIRQSLQLKLE